MRNFLTIAVCAMAVIGQVAAAAQDAVWTKAVIKLAKDEDITD